MPAESDSTELANELVLEQIEKGAGSLQGHKWHRTVALSTLVLALLAALGGLLSGITSHEAQLKRTEEIIEFTILESDRVSIEVLKAKHDILASLGESPSEAEVTAIQRYEDEIEGKRKVIFEEEFFAEVYKQIHLIFAIAVTILAVGISVSGMSVVVDQKWLWGVGMIFGLVGGVGVVLGIIFMLLD